VEAIAALRDEIRQKGREKGQLSVDREKIMARHGKGS
jgi:hypothetical protein